MAKPKLAPANEWQNREINDWNVTTFHAYLSEKHFDRYGIKYMPWRSWNMEKGMLKHFLNDDEKDTLKTFIDECFKAYKPTHQYPSLSFGFMYTYMRSQIMPKIYEKRKVAFATQIRAAKQKEKQLSIDDMLDLL